MYRIGLAVLSCLLFVACNGNDSDEGVKTVANEENTTMAFGNRFPARSLPYQLTDTSLLNNNDTASLPAAYLSSLLPDSLVKQAFGKNTGIKYTPLAKVEEKDKPAYYIVKGTSGSKKAAFLLVFEKDSDQGTTLPFLLPDNKPSTSQTATLDKSYTVTKSTIQRDGTTITGEGREVLSYDAGEKKFTLVMTDLLNDRPAVLVNPLDTFPKTNRLAGDYYLNKKNLIAVRDGRHSNQILVYIHTENGDGDCIGELKGEFIMTSTTTAVYRQGGDPCVLGLTFTGNSVSMNEERGCGNHRGLDCPFDGKFTRKKEEKPKETTKKPKQSKRPR